MVAGLQTISADPPQLSTKGFRSDPSPSAMPRATFADNKVTFRLLTPADQGVRSHVNEHRAPERPPLRVVANERLGSFARGRGACMHYRHMQQLARYIVPSLPTQSRTDESVHYNARLHEMQRTLTLQSMELNEQRRQARLRQAKTLMNTKSTSKEISQKLQASCSLPDFTDFGEQTPVLQLLNRRVDYNHLKKCRLQMAQQQKAVVVKQAVVETPELKELIEDIARFEEDHLQEQNVVLETVVDWKNSTTISFGQQDP